MRLFLLFLLTASITATAQGAPELLFREDWKETPAEIPLGQNHVAHPDLTVALYGPGFAGIKKSHHDFIENDPYYVWSGACPGNWAVTLSHKRGAFDLSDGGSIRWRSRQSGFRQLRVLLRLEDGNWLVSDLYDGISDDWHVWEVDLKKIRWRKLNIERVTEEDWQESPSLNRVIEVGFTDLMPGGMTPASSRLDWIEVLGRWSPAE
jgi:hypothetical protein